MFLKRAAGLLVVFVLVCFLAVWLTLRGEGKTPAVSPTPTPYQPPPSVAGQLPEPGYFPGEPSGVNFSYSGVVPQIPAEAIIYQASRSADIDNQVLLLAKSLGLASPQTIADKPGQNTLLWVSATTTLSYDKNDGGLSLSFSPPPGGVPAEPDAAVRSFLHDRLKIPESLPLRLVSAVAQGNTDGLIYKGVPPKLTSLSYDYQVEGGYPLLLGGGYTPPINALVDGAGGIWQLLMIFPPAGMRAVQQKPLLPFGAAIQSLNAGLGRLIYTSGGVGSAAWEVAPVFSSVSLSSFSLVYKDDPETGLVGPLYVFEGVAQTKNGTMEVRYVVNPTN